MDSATRAHLTKLVSEGDRLEALKGFVDLYLKSEEQDALAALQTNKDPHLVKADLLAAGRFKDRLTAFLNQTKMAERKLKENG